MDQLHQSTQNQHEYYASKKVSCIIKAPTIEFKLKLNDMKMSLV